MKIYKYGFYHKGIRYGWLNKELYRLPYTNSSNYSFVLKKLEPITIGNKVGYRVGGDRKTIEQLKAITIPINHIEHEIKDKDCPF